MHRGVNTEHTVKEINIECNNLITTMRGITGAFKTQTLVVVVVVVVMVVGIHCHHSVYSTQ